MKFLLSVVLIALVSFIAGLYLPWWSIAIVPFLVAVWMRQSAAAGFIAGFTGIFVLWVIVAAWINYKNDSILSHKIALLFPLGGSSFLLIIVTAFVGGLVGGFAAMSGSLVWPAKGLYK